MIPFLNVVANMNIFAVFLLALVCSADGIARTCHGNPGLLPANPRGKVLLYIANDEKSHNAMVTYLRQNAPTWWKHFFEPQRLSLLVVFDTLSYTVQHAQKFEEFCTVLGIQSEYRTVMPRNGAQKYFLESSEIEVYMRTFENTFPFDKVEGLAEVCDSDGTNTVVYSGEKRPRPCARETSYVVGTRAYANPVLWMIPELDDTHYVVKLDFDIFFFDAIPFHVGGRMHQTRTLVAHTGVACEGDPVCSYEFEEEREKAMREASIDMCFARRENWTVTDYFYTNLIFVSVQMMRHKQTQKLLAHLYESRHWFFARWTDQIVFHQPLLLLVSAPQRHILDLTQYRCVPRREWHIPFLWQVVQTREEFLRSCNGTTFHHKARAHDFFYEGAVSKPSPILKRPYCSN